MLEVNQS